MAVKPKQDAQQPLILRVHRLMDAFAKSDDERDFYLDRTEGFIVYVDLDKSSEELEALESELVKNSDRYSIIPKMTFYETKKFMEGFVNEKVYDIDTKEKLLEIIQSKEARTNFLEFLYDHHTELEKWQQYYQERSRVRIIEWLRQNHFHFVFEEDLELPKTVLEKVKQSLFQANVDKEIQAIRKTLVAKAKGYYSNEALNPRPKRGRPPKQIAKQEIELQVTSDVYLKVPPVVRPFLYTPEVTGSPGVAFAPNFDLSAHIAARRPAGYSETEVGLESFQQKIAALRRLSAGWVEQEKEESIDLNEKEEDEEKPTAKRQAAPPSKSSIKSVSQNSKTAPRKTRFRSIINKDNRSSFGQKKRIMPVQPASNKKPKSAPTLSTKKAPGVKTQSLGVKPKLKPLRKLPIRKAPIGKKPEAKSKPKLQPLKKITSKAAPASVKKKSVPTKMVRAVQKPSKQKAQKPKPKGRR